MELDALVAGERPDLLTWVRAYGVDGATLVPQPDDIWEHPRCSVQARADGGWHLALPLWTTAESPSDLSAEVDVTASGSATITDVHVL